MERRRRDHLENPFLSYYLRNHLGLPPTTPSEQQNNLLPQNPIPQNPNFSSDPSLHLQLLQRLYQNPTDVQNNFISAENLQYNNQPHLSYPITFDSSPLESGFYLNPNLSSFAEPFNNQTHSYETLALDAAFSRLNLSSAANSYQSPHNQHSQSSINQNFQSLMNGGHYSQSSINQNVQSLINGRREFSDMKRTMSANLGFRANSNSSLNNRPYNQSSFLCNNRINSQRRSPSSLSSYNHSTRAAGSDYQIRRLHAIESGQLLSSLYNFELENENSNSIYTSMEQVKGRIVMVARDQEGCRFLQKKIDEQIPEQTEIIFLEVKDHLCDLVVDQFANYLIQKLFSSVNEDQMAQLLISLIKNEKRLLDVCIHPHGTRAVQKMIEHIRSQDQTSTLISALKNITVSLSTNTSGQHVIQQCIKCFRSDDTKILLEEIAKKCVEIAMDEAGCCVLQRCVDQAQGELKELLVAQIATNALLLAESPYGNYVVQYVLEMRMPRASAKIWESLRGHCVFLSMNKFASHVVEKCLKECSEEIVSAIIEELMQSPEFLGVLQDPFGNYVMQSALAISKGELHNTLVGLINYYYPYLHSHLHGKKVLAKTRGTKYRI